MSKKKEQINKNRFTKEAVLYYVLFAFVLCLVGILCFYKLDAKYVDAWDEARHGVNAYEMANGGNLIQNTYLRQADYYNLKPPVSMWGIMVGFLLFGNTVFGLRFYAALSYLILVALAGLFARRYGKLESLFVMAFLAINTTPFQAHMIRAGDADSLYVLLFTIAMLAMMLIKDRVEWVYVCAFASSLAFLTKSFHALLIPAIGFVYLVATGLIKRLKGKDWAIFLSCLLLPVLGWAALRIRIDGMTFIKAMWETDVLGRTSGELKNNISPFTYYLEYYFGASSGKTPVYLCALVVWIVALFRYPYLFAWKKRENWLGYVMWFFVPFLAFSAVTNKLIWYVYPALIPLLMVAGIFMARLVKDQNLMRVLRVISALAAAVILIYYVDKEVEILKTQGPNEIQSLLTQVMKENDIQGAEAFVEYEQIDSIGDETAWCQQDVFICEIKGGLSCINGGAEALEEALDRGDGPKLLLTAKSKNIDLGLLPVAASERYAVYLCR